MSCALMAVGAGTGRRAPGGRLLRPLGEDMRLRQKLPGACACESQTEGTEIQGPLSRERGPFQEDGGHVPGSAVLDLWRTRGVGPKESSASPLTASGGGGGGGETEVKPHPGRPLCSGLPVLPPATRAPLVLSSPPPAVKVRGSPEVFLPSHVGAYHRNIPSACGVLCVRGSQCILPASIPPVTFPDFPVTCLGPWSSGRVLFTPWDPRLCAGLSRRGRSPDRLQQERAQCASEMFMAQETYIQTQCLQ